MSNDQPPEAGWWARFNRRPAVIEWRARLNRALAWVERNVPPGLRLLLGLLLICGGVLGFLPILGFWMIPLGVAVAAMDVRALRQRFRGD